MEKTIITVLGCGSSGGVPSIEYGYGDCDANNPKNNRTRPSIFVEQGQKRLLIDVSPEFRLQAINNKIPVFENVLFTHEHIDHTGGVPDLRDVISMAGKPLNLFGKDRTVEAVERIFPFAFQSRTGSRKLNSYAIWSGRKFQIGGFEIIPTEMDHGSSITSLGYRFNDFAYTTDVKRLSDVNKGIINGVKVWIISCLSDKDSDYHAPLHEVLGWIEELKPERAYLTHMRGDMDYERLKAKLPSHVEPCYDGLKIEV